MTTEIQSCGDCRYFLPINDTHYNKQCGYCGNFRVQRTRVCDSKACKLFEIDAKAPKTKPP